MVRNGNDGALPSKKAEAHFGVSAPSQIKWHSGRTPLPPGAFGMSATTSTALGPMQCGTGRGGALMPSPLSTSPANAPGCTQRREGDSPSFFAATADRCGRVAHTPIATSRRYRRGSMWAGRPHSYGGQQLRIGEDQCGRVAHTPMATSRRYRRGSTAWSQHRDRGSDWARMRQRALLLSQRTQMRAVPPPN